MNTNPIHLTSFFRFPRSTLSVARWTLNVLPLLLLLLCCATASAAVRFVDVNSADPKPPYTDWATAARVIQDAVDAAAAGDEIVVTNGTYATGGRAVHGTMTNRVAVDKPLTLRSVNGPMNTIIQGYQVPGTTNGDGAIRCVYLADGASLSGFTLTNGATQLWTGDGRDDNGGGLWCESTGAVVSNCVIAGNSACDLGGGAYGGTLSDCSLSANQVGQDGGGVYGGTLNNCLLKGNSAMYGGGAAACTLNHCALMFNSASYHGGGVSGSTLNNCTLTTNSASYTGGGSSMGTLTDCTLTGNSAGDGGGTFGGTVNNCTLSGNSALSRGGGAYGAELAGGTLNNCLLTGNSADYGGGASGAALNNCTLTGNAARFQGGGTFGSLVNNCVAHYNTAVEGANYSGGVLNYCCTAPMPTDGVGNITLDPLLASTSHLSASSPCRGAGSAASAAGTDIDGEAWGDPPAIGCDEFHPGSVTGTLTVGLTVAYTNVAVGYPVALTARIEGRTSASLWEFGDGSTATNQPYVSHAWAMPGDYAVVLRAVNESNPSGLTATGTVHIVAQTVHHVASDSRNPQAPYTNWATAAVTIQDAVDAAAAAGALVLVSNGVYATGGRAVYGTMTNRVTVDKPLSLLSVNGPQSTVIEGRQVPAGDYHCGDAAIRCVYLASGASLSGFTLTKGATRVWTADYSDHAGGGVWCELGNAIVSNCVLQGNSAYEGGGAARGTLSNCTLTGNLADQGGGASWSALHDCTLADNSSRDGGGACYSTLQSCALTGNCAGVGGGAASSTLVACELTANSALYGGGGGASNSTLDNCTLTGNSAARSGGGAAGGLLNACTLVGNRVNSTNMWDGGGGASGSTINNCIVFFNTATYGANYSADCSLNHCATTPDPGGLGNITNAPLFVDAANGNFRLQSNSPCINAGNNAYVNAGTDLDGNPRIVSGTVDIGAYEFQGSGSTISYAWLQRYGLPTDGSADVADPDADGLNTWQEWRCQTDPTNALSVLRLLSATPVGTDVLVRWPGVEGVSYFLERSIDLGAAPPFAPLATNLLGVTGTNTLTDTNAAALPGLFYRVGVPE